MARIVLFNGVTLDDLPTVQVVSMLPIPVINDVLGSLESDYLKLAEAQNIEPSALRINPLEVLSDLRAALGIEKVTKMTTNNNAQAAQANTETAQRGYTRPFLGFVAEYGQKALADWLQQQNAPAEIRDLAEGLAGVTMALSENSPVVGSGYLEAVGSQLAQISRGLAFTQAQLHTPDSILTA